MVRAGRVVEPLDLGRLEQQQCAEVLAGGRDFGDGGAGDDANGGLVGAGREITADLSCWFSLVAIQGAKFITEAADGRPSVDRGEGPRSGTGAIVRRDQSRAVQGRRAYIETTE